MKKIALTRHVSTDSLLLEADESGPDDRLKLQFETVSKLDQQERDAVGTIIAGVLHMHDAKRWTQPLAPALSSTPEAKKKTSGAHSSTTRG